MLARGVWTADGMAGKNGLCVTLRASKLLPQLPEALHDALRVLLVKLTIHAGVGHQPC